MLYIASIHQCHASIQCQPYYKLSTLPTVKWTCTEVCEECKCLFNKAKEEGKDLLKCLMIYCNTPITDSFQSPMQILQDRSATSDLPMSNVARKQLGIQSEVIRNSDNQEVLPTHDLHVG